MKAMFKTKGMLASIFLLMPSIVNPAIAGAVVIGHPSLPVNQLNPQQVTDLFLGKTNRLANGTTVVVVDHQEGETIKEEFYKNVVGKNPKQLKAYWAKLIFTGEGVPPHSFNGDEAVKQHVASTPGAIGYVSDGAVDGSVKVLLKP